MLLILEVLIHKPQIVIPAHQQFPAKPAKLFLARFEPLSPVAYIAQISV